MERAIKEDISFLIQLVRSLEEAVLKLEEYYEKTSSDLIVLLLGDMLFWPTGDTIDPAAWIEWDAAVKKILHEQISKNPVNDEVMGISITESQSFRAMVQFFRHYNFWQRWNQEVHEEKNKIF